MPRGPPSGLGLVLSGIQASYYPGPDKDCLRYGWNPEPSAGGKARIDENGEKRSSIFNQRNGEIEHVAWAVSKVRMPRFEDEWVVDTAKYLECG